MNGKYPTARIITIRNSTLLAYKTYKRHAFNSILGTSINPVIREEKNRLVHRSFSVQKIKMMRSVDVHVKTLTPSVRTLLSSIFTPKQKPPSLPLPLYYSSRSSSPHAASRVFSNAVAFSSSPIRGFHGVADGNHGGLEEETKLSLPVRAYFFSTSVDLKGLVEQNKHNFIPPTSRMTNYVVLKFGNHTDPTGTGGCISGSECIYMVVFHSNNEDTNGMNPALDEGRNKINKGNAKMGVKEMKERVYELERECMSMKQDLGKLVKPKEERNFFSKIFGLKSKNKTSPCGGGGKRGEEDALLMIREAKN
ncbi:hypothetical protein Bca52824_056563 [Brassica carinata]|uniref:Uncharacterized protein n=1 Tax=Brassica carinata TaxID=52824 RepID=A0A8X7QUL5_BRACI|nr:hypothetical protein Bca52824_056563 [Brassica carinata]